MTHTTDAPPRTASAAAEGRSAFVDAVLNDFVANSGQPVSDTVRDFILNEVLVSDDEWETAASEGRLDIEPTRAILTESLSTSAGVGEAAGVRVDVVELGPARDAFYDVIHDRWKCPFPFIFC